jgi:hypothetical protein
MFQKSPSIKIIYDLKVLAANIYGLMEVGTGTDILIHTFKLMGIGKNQDKDIPINKGIGEKTDMVRNGFADHTDRH